jgi:hypothetical protein
LACIAALRNNDRASRMQSIAHRLLSTTADDCARFSLLFTLSRDKIAVKPVVSAEVPKRLQTTGGPEVYRRGAKHEG